MRHKKGEIRVIGLVPDATLIYFATPLDDAARVGVANNDSVDMRIYSEAARLSAYTGVRG